MVVTTLLVALVSFFYATAAQAGGTAFLAIMALMNFTSDEMRPTALLLNVVAAAYSTWRLHQNGSIDWGLLVRLALPSLPVMFIGSVIALPSNSYFILTGLVLLTASALILFKPTGQMTIGDIRLLPAAVVGSTAGFFSGLTGVGGGVFLTPILIAMGWLLPKRAAALSAPFILANSIVGLLGVLLAGQRIADGAGYYAIGALVGAYFGTWIGIRFMSDRSTRYVLAGLLLVAGLRLLTSSVVSLG